MKKYLKTVISPKDPEDFNLPNDDNDEEMNKAWSSTLKDISNTSPNHSSRASPTSQCSIQNNNKTKDNSTDNNNFDQDENGIHSKCLAGMRGYKKQATFLKKKLTECETEAQHWKAKYEELAKQTAERQTAQSGKYVRANHFNYLCLYV